MGFQLRKPKSMGHQLKDTIYSRFRRLIGASQIFLLNRISLISKDTYLLSKIQEHVLFEDYQLS